MCACTPLVSIRAAWPRRWFTQAPASQSSGPVNWEMRRQTSARPESALVPHDRRRIPCLPQRPPESLPGDRRSRRAPGRLSTSPNSRSSSRLYSRHDECSCGSAKPARMPGWRADMDSEPRSAWRSSSRRYSALSCCSSGWRALPRTGLHPIGELPAGDRIKPCAVDRLLAQPSRRLRPPSCQGSAGCQALPLTTALTSGFESR